MKAKTFIILIFATISLVITSCSNSKISAGNEVIVKIEKFKVDKGRLPNNLTEIGIIEDESGPIYYEKKTEMKYILWFGKQLGESMTYDSETKQWK
jgi:hypothetical protein